MSPSLVSTAFCLETILSSVDILDIINSSFCEKSDIHGFCAAVTGLNILAGINGFGGASILVGCPTGSRTIILGKSILFFVLAWHGGLGYSMLRYLGASPSPPLTFRFTSGFPIL